ncbi:TetR/AcrR family transcriptional regulator [Sphingomonas sp. MMS24-J45]|uniref:TetR/AcrR family transcriptional regulator n=1 Tax=Sphingomonas sp. MMS24-J45 TaxID=3238806 RepID=UPI00384E8BEF
MARPTTDLEAGREALLDHVEALIAQRGGVSITLAELAAAANMSPANLYRFFENKEALYQAVAERWFAPKVRAMEEVLASDLPIRQKFHAFYARRLAMILADYERDPALFRSYLELGHQHMEIVRGFIDLADHFLAQLIAEAIAEGYFAGFEIDAAVSLVNLMVQTFCDPELVVLLIHSVNEQKLAIVIDTIFDGMRADRPNNVHRLREGAR